MKVLLIEDNPGDARLVREMLKEAIGDFSINVAERFGLGLEFLAGEDVDIVLLDLNLPDSHGLETFTRLQGEFSHLPVVIMTGSSDEALGVQAVQSGAQDYLVKGQVECKQLARALAYAIERKRAELLTQLERDKLTGILNSMEDGVCIINQDFGMVYINPTMKSQYGAIDRRKCYRYFNGFDDACPWCNKEEVLAGKILRREVYLEKTGRTCEVTDTPIKNADGSVSKLAIFHDITERKKVEQLKDEFIGMVSHELKTPLTIIMGALHIAMEKGLSKGQIQELIRDAIRYSHTLDGIIENLLELSRSQANRLALQTEKVDIGRIAREVAQKLQGNSTEHRIYVDIAADTPSVIIDRTRIERVLYNLVENAIKYSPGGGEVRVFDYQRNNQLVIAVMDQGIGISSADRTRLFQPFERLQMYEKDGIPGLGLGLRVCRILVEAHGGQMWVESEPGQGSTFFFTVPIEDQ
jgi:signal transduction histidine kinase